MYYQVQYLRFDKFYFSGDEVLCHLYHGYSPRLSGFLCNTDHPSPIIKFE